MPYLLHSILRLMIFHLFDILKIYHYHCFYFCFLWNVLCFQNVFMIRFKMMCIQLWTITNYLWNFSGFAMLFRNFCYPEIYLQYPSLVCFQASCGYFFSNYYFLCKIFENLLVRHGWKLSNCLMIHTSLC